MVTPREQKEMVLKYENRTEFAESFNKKYSATMPLLKLAGRVRSLWECRATHADEIAAFHKKEEESQHTVMIPKRIVTKHTPSSDSIPDVGELLIRTNNLLAELVQLQKEQIALFKEMRK